VLNAYNFIAVKMCIFSSLKLNQKYKLVFGNNLELKIKIQKISRIEIRTRVMCVVSKRSNHCTMLLHGKHTAVTRYRDMKWCSVNILCKQLKLGVKMMEFSDGVSDLDSRRHKACFIR
jgi:hypothetical protein